MTHDRLITLNGAMNFRDLGGYINDHKQTVRWNKIYRADSLSRLSEADCNKLAQLRITIDCDLRSLYEQKIAPDKRWPHVKVVDVHLYEENTEDLTGGKHEIAKFIHHIPTIKDYLGNIYQRVLLNRHSQKMFARIFEQLLALPEKDGLVFHCSAGKDRTGMTAALILMGLGVNDRQISQDYLLTNELYNFGLEQKEPTNDELTRMIAKMNVMEGEGAAIIGITETVRKGWGSFDNFFIKVLGFSRGDLLNLRRMYLEGGDLW